MYTYVALYCSHSLGYLLNISTPSFTKRVLSSGVTPSSFNISVVFSPGRRSWKSSDGSGVTALLDNLGWTKGVAPEDASSAASFGLSTGNVHASNPMISGTIIEKYVFRFGKGQHTCKCIFPLFPSITLEATLKEGARSGPLVAIHLLVDRWDLCAPPLQEGRWESTHEFL